jgi:hypothetical protein
MNLYVYIVRNTFFSFNDTLLQDQKNIEKRDFFSLIGICLVFAIIE